MTEWYRFTIFMGDSPDPDRVFSSSLREGNALCDQTEWRKALHTEVECWTERLASNEIREKLRAGLALYAAEYGRKAIL